MKNIYNIYNICKWHIFVFLLVLFITLLIN